MKPLLYNSKFEHLNMIKFSIIIPVFNGENFINQCIESIIDENYFNYEIIVINDGSTDNTPNILDNLSKQYNFIKVLHVNNGGVSKARNIGINKAQGEYISFVDADDFVTKNYISELFDLIEKKKDLYLFNYIRWISKDKEEIGRLRIPEGEYSDKKILYNEACGLEICCLSVCLAIFRRDIIIQNKLSFNINMKTCEDFMFSLSYYQYVNSFCIKNIPLYYYRLNNNSATIKRKLSHANDYATVFNKIRFIQDEKNIEKEHIDEFNIRWTRWIIELIANYSKQGIKKNEICKNVYNQSYYNKTLQMKGYGMMFYIENLLLKMKSPIICNIYISLLSKLKYCLGKYKL